MVSQQQSEKSTTIAITFDQVLDHFKEGKPYPKGEMHQFIKKSVERYKNPKSKLTAEDRTAFEDLVNQCPPILEKYPEALQVLSLEQLKEIRDKKKNKEETKEETKEEKPKKSKEDRYADIKAYFDLGNPYPKGEMHTLIKKDFDNYIQNKSTSRLNRPQFEELYILYPQINQNPKYVELKHLLSNQPQVQRQITDSQRIIDDDTVQFNALIEELGSIDQAFDDVIEELYKKIEKLPNQKEKQLYRRNVVLVCRNAIDNDVQDKKNIATITKRLRSC